MQNVIDLDEWIEEAGEEGRSDPGADVPAPGVYRQRPVSPFQSRYRSRPGAALNQPWLNEKSYIFLADVAGDWLADVAELEEEGLEGYLCGGRRSNVIPFRHPVKDEEDDDPA